MNRTLRGLLVLLSAGLLALLLAGPVAGLRASPLSRSAADQSAKAQASACLVGGQWGMLDNWGMTGSGMMNDSSMMGQWNGSGNMWGMMGNSGMMGWYSPNAQPISTTEAQQRLSAFAASCGPDIAVSDMTVFGSNYYAVLVDGSQNGLGEVLVDRYTGAIYPEPGPNMMWNTQWGLARGAAAAAQYDLAHAQDLASTFLESYLPGATVLEGRALPGYYTFDFGHDQIEGMLSVDAASGQIWVHTWHGPALGAVQ